MVEGLAGDFGLLLRPSQPHLTRRAALGNTASPACGAGAGWGSWI